LVKRQKRKYVGIPSDIIKTDDDDDDGLKNILLYQTQKVHFDKPNLEQCLEIEAGKTKTEHILVESSSDN